MKTRKLIELFIILAVSTSFFSCASTGPDASDPLLPPAAAVAVDHDTFPDEVLRYRGNALVLFYNEEFAQSRDMMARFDHFAAMFEEEAKFCKFYWDMDMDGKPYGLQLLPTMVLYKNGVEIDRMRGIPPKKKDRLALNDDIELWILKNVIGLEGDKYAGKFTYLFNNTYKLYIGNK